MKLHKLALIAGHTGPGTGAVGHIDEGAETIRLRNRIDDHLLMKYNFVSLVDDDTNALSKVRDEVKKALKQDDYSLDIHFNAATDSSASGVEIFIPSEASKSEQDFAQAILNATVNVLGIRNRGIKTEGLSQHSKLAMLSGVGIGNNALLEVCFVSNKNDADVYNEKFEELAEALADTLWGICSENAAIPLQYQA